MILFLLLPHFFLGSFLDGNCVLAEVEATQFVVDPLGAARGIKHVLALLVIRLQVLAVYLIVDFFDDL